MKEGISLSLFLRIDTVGKMNEITPFGMLQEL